MCNGFPALSCCPHFLLTEAGPPVLLAYCILCRALLSIFFDSSALQSFEFFLPKAFPHVEWTSQAGGRRWRGWLDGLSGCIAGTGAARRVPGHEGGRLGSTEHGRVCRGGPRTMGRGRQRRGDHRPPCRAHAGPTCVMRVCFWLLSAWIDHRRGRECDAKFVQPSLRSLRMVRRLLGSGGGRGWPVGGLLSLRKVRRLLGSGAGRGWRVGGRVGN